MSKPLFTFFVDGKRAQTPIAKAIFDIAPGIILDMRAGGRMTKVRIYDASASEVERIKSYAATL